jgi:hypothetical protein
MSSPTARTLAHFRKLGFPCVDIVERRVFRHVTKDLFGCIDVLAMDANGAVTAVQATSGSNVSARVKKIMALPAWHVMRLAGWRVVVQGWRKNAKGRYVLREVDLS